VVLQEFLMQVVRASCAAPKRGVGGNGCSGRKAVLVAFHTCKKRLLTVRTQHHERPPQISTCRSHTESFGITVPSSLSRPLVAGNRSGLHGGLPIRQLNPPQVSGSRVSPRVPSASKLISGNCLVESEHSYISAGTFLMMPQTHVPQAGKHTEGG
jgi:hypothetical protein